MDKQCCGSCRFWFWVRDGVNGKCRVFPPEQVVVDVPTGSVENNVMEMRTIVKTQFPQTDSLEWCGSCEAK